MMKATAAITRGSLPLSCCASRLRWRWPQATTNPPPEDYSLDGRIIEDNFLTSQIQLVLLVHVTVSRRGLLRYRNRLDHARVRGD